MDPVDVLLLIERRRSDGRRMLPWFDRMHRHIDIYRMI